MSSDAAPTLFTLAEAARVLLSSVKDKSYRATPLGQLVGRYIRWCRNERGLVDNTTIRDYEGTLARMALTLSDLQPADVTIDDLRLVVDLWAHREPNTRKKVTSAIRGFWKWAEDEGYVERSPAARLRSPKVPQRSPDLLPMAVDTRLIAAAQTARDRLAVIVLLDYGLRRSELTGIVLSDFDLSRRTLTVFGKGQKERVLPLRGRVILALEEHLLTPLRGLERTPEPDDYLLYPERRNKHAVSWAKPKQRMNGQGAHRWWYYLLRDAGLVEKDVQRGMHMHRARHTFAVELRRDARDLGVVQHMLGHSDSSTTEQYYGHYDMTDLERAMEQFAKRRQ